MTNHIITTVDFDDHIYSYSFDCLYCTARIIKIGSAIVFAQIDKRQEIACGECGSEYVVALRRTETVCE